MSRDRSGVGFEEAWFQALSANVGRIYSLRGDGSDVELFGGEEREHLGDHGPRVDPPGDEGEPDAEGAKQGNRCSGLVVDADAGAGAARRSREHSRRETFGSSARVDRHGEPTGLAHRSIRPAERPCSEPARDGEPRLVVIEVADVARAEGLGARDRVEPHARGETADDQHGRSGAVQEGLGDRAIAVRYVVPGAGQELGGHTLGGAYEHGVGEGNANHVGEHSSVGTAAELPEAVHGTSGHARARRGQPSRAGSHAPQETWNGTTTRSPGETEVTSVPTSSTSATHSCPKG